jgi:DNA-binding NtrC family response regulator
LTKSPEDPFGLIRFLDEVSCSSFEQFGFRACVEVATSEDDLKPGSLGPELFPEQFFQNGSHEPSLFPAESLDGRSLFEIMEGCERRIILDMLTRTNWSQTDASERFKIPLSTLNQKIKRLQIDVKRRREA